VTNVTIEPSDGWIAFVKRLRNLLLASVLAGTALIPALVSTPASACHGDVCDSFCATIDQLNEKLPPKLQLTNCQLG